MTYSPFVLKFADLREQESRKRPSDRALLICEHSYQLGLKVKAIGERHAREGTGPASVDEFRKVLRPIDQDELREEIALMLHDYYMEGYRKGGDQE